MLGTKAGEPWYEFHVLRNAKMQSKSVLIVVRPPLELSGGNNTEGQHILRTNQAIGASNEGSWDES